MRSITKCSSSERRRRCRRRLEHFLMRLFRLSPSTLAIPIALLFVSFFTRDAGAQRRRSSDYSSRVDTTFAFDKNGSVTVSSNGGDIVVTGWARPQVHVRATSDDDNIRLDLSSSRM